ncbi:hypothetical protein XENTR_v10021369 [Xenopus tropicalis]|nr:hypothetical protein XENTR_v10021369 [Xenopus tropicalis]
MDLKLIKENTEVVNISYILNLFDCRSSNKIQVRCREDWSLEEDSVPTAIQGPAGKKGEPVTMEGRHGKYTPGTGSHGFGFYKSGNLSIVNDSSCLLHFIMQLRNEGTSTASTNWEASGNIYFHTHINK